MKKFITTFVSLPNGWLTKVTHHLSIGQKIRYGYAFSLSIAVVGIVAGFIIGDYYHQPARQQKDEAQYQLRLLYRLQTAVLQARTSEQQFIPLVQKPEELKKEYSEFSNYAAQLRQVWSEVNSYINSETDQHYQPAEGIPDFLQTYSRVPEAYLQQVEQLMQRISPEHLNSQDVETAQKLLLNFSTSPIALKYDVIDDDLNQVINASDRDDKNAEAMLEKAETIRLQIVVGSILLSVMLATLFANHTSRMLTAPIVAVTNVALRTTEELKFDLFAPVMTADEVGVLANSLNSLIKRVAEYTYELELARQTLESRVKERTQELSQALSSLQQTQSQLIQSEKMSALGQLVAGVAHEINNPVNFIYGNLTYVSDYMADLLSLINLYQERYSSTDPEISDRIEEIGLDFISKDLPKTLNSMQVGAERIRDIVLTLRNFSRLDEADMKSVNLHEGIDSTLLILQHRLKALPKRSAIKIVKEYGNLPQVECYAGQLNQVFMNILSNSLDALSMRTGEFSQSSIPTIIIRTEVLENNWVRISIKDNGPGMTQSVRTRVFDFFFTTKQVGEGTGLGLSISYQIVVDRHKGKLTCLSTPGEGAEFKIEIPISLPVRV